MIRCTVTLSANAGIALTTGGDRLMIDALHDTPVPGFSPVSRPLLERLRQTRDFCSPTAICYTHCHADHYARALTQDWAERWPQAELILPEPEFRRQLLLQGAEVRVRTGGLELHFFRLVHAQDAAGSIPHYGLIVSDGRIRVLLAGDCEPGDPAVAAALGGAPVDVAILNFPWATLKRGRTCLERQLRPAHLLLVHLPFAEDDSAGYRRAARTGAALLQGIPDVRCLDVPLQREELVLTVNR